MSPINNRYERLLQFNVAVIVVLGIVMLGMGQRDLRLGLLAIVATAAALFLTDIMRWVRLNRTLANIAALTAVGFSIADFFRFESETQLLAIANLLIYLQCVLLFQEKQLRVYWQILVLSLLQVVVGAALNLGVVFGLLMVIYMLLMLSAGMLLFIRHEVSRRVRNDPFAEPLSAMILQSQSLKSTDSNTLSWTDTTVTQLPNADHNSINQLLHSGFLRRLMSMGCGTLLIAAAVFFCLPRFGSSMWHPVGLTAQRTVGFSSSVSLGALGEVSENPELVMRVEFLSRDADVPYSVVGEPLFRGSILDNYSRGEWTFFRRRFSRATGGLSPAPTNGTFVRQRITIEPLDEPVLFGIYPMFQSDEGYRDRRVRFNYDLRQLMRTDGSQSERLTYELLTGGLVNGRQRSIVPELEPLRFDLQKKQLLQLPFTIGTADPYNTTLQQSRQRRLDVDPRDDLPELVAAARRQVTNAKLDADDPEYRHKVAKLLERYFLTGRFSYSLRPQSRDRSIDPIEDFIKNNPRGHCEYFASALTLMLRSQGVPARMVIGFKGGEFNALGGFYQVRQLHAHAWVEAYLEPDEIPETDRVGNYVNHAGWMTLDPTPANADAAEFDERGWLNSVADLGDYLQSLWSTYVVGLNAERQRDVVYGPLSEIADQSTLLTTLTALPGRVWQTIRDWRNWLRPSSIAVILLTMLTIYGLVNLVRWIASRMLQTIGHSIRTPRRKPSQVDFYDRLEQLLGRFGLMRSDRQTPLEFALACGAELGANDQSRQFAILPRRIVEAYYRVRFGRHALDSHEAHAVEQQLLLLEAMLNQLAGKQPVPSA